MVVFSLTALLAQSAVQAADPRLDLRTTVSRDDNVGRSERARDRRADEILTLAGRLTLPLRLSSAAVMSLEAGVQRQQHEDLDGLDGWQAGGGARLRWRPRGGFTAPWYEVHVGADAIRVDGSELRNGYLLRTGVVAGRRLTDRIRLRAGYGFEHRRAEGSAVFDLDSHRLFGAADYHLAGRALLYARVEGRHGDVFSLATPDPQILAAAEARVAEDALRGPAGGPLVAYRLQAETVLAELGVNLPIGSAVALDASALMHRSNGRGGIDYDGLVLQVSLLFRRD